MSAVETLPLLVVAVLLLSAGGAEPETMEVVFDGTHEVTDVDDALIVGGGSVTVPANATTTGALYVIGGDVRVNGRIEGDVRLLAGNLTVTDTAAITGTLQVVAGQSSVADGASVASRTTVDLTPRERSPARALAFLVARLLLMAALAAWLARRAPALLDNVADSITDHTVVSGVVGALAGATLLVLFVYMAFTLVLLPLSVVGLVAEFLTVVYSYLVYGYVVGRRLPVERVEAASALGVVGFMLALELLGQVPVVGALVQFLVVAVGLGAVLITYFGLREFEPAGIPA